MTSSPELTDWRGNPYTVGTRVIYAAMSGRSVELQEATVLEIKKVYRDTYEGKWVQYFEGDPAPREKKYNRDTETWEPTGPEITKFEMRVKLQPEGKGSRDFSIRNDTEVFYIGPDGAEVGYTQLMKLLEAEHGPSYTWNETTNYMIVRNWEPEDFGYERKEIYVKPRPVTLTVIDNITVIKD